MPGDAFRVGDIGATRPILPPLPQQPDHRAGADPAPGQRQAEPQQRRQAIADAIADKLAIPRGDLVIEKNQYGQGFIYKIVDPQSKKVVLEWPREQFVELVQELPQVSGLLVDSAV